MRRIALLCAPLFALVATCITLASPAHASTTCNDAYNGIGWYKYCAIQEAVSGASASGTSIWKYPSPDPNTPQGNFDVTFKDTAADGHCVQARLMGANAVGDAGHVIIYSDHDACGVGATQTVNWDGINFVGSLSGYPIYRVQLCVENVACTKIWAQDATATHS